MRGKKQYDYAALSKIKQFDVALMFKKQGSDMDAINSILVDFMAVSKQLDVDVEEILPNHKTFMEGMNHLTDLLQRMFATTILWDANNLIEAIKTGTSELVAERYEALRISNGHLIRRIYYAQCDDEGKLIHELPKAKENPLLVDRELRNQESCIGEPILVPMEQMAQIAQMIGDLKLDKASEHVKSLLTFKYDGILDVRLTAVDTALEEFDFDRAEELMAEAIACAEEINAERSKPRTVRKRILAVDDVQDILTSIKGMLNDIYDVCCVTNATSALRFLQVQKPDVILLDIELSDTDGFALLEKIRATEGCEEIPVMFLTSHTTMDYIQRARDAGVQDFLRKPINAVDLITRCAKHLQQGGEA